MTANFEALYNYTEHLSGITLSADEKKIFYTHFKPKKLRKRQYFLQEGDVCKYTGFITKGAAKTFTVDEKGNEHILRLSVEDWWLADFESFYKLTPSRYNIEALEDMEILQITNAVVEEYIKPIPSFAAMQNVLSQNNTIAAQKRMQSSISRTGEERFHEFIHDFPHFLQRFPQNLIASYLGLTPESLSRIRKNSLK
ncbi:cyclic nucleotide binding-regulatory protein [Pedobacter sp. BAL39]|uniref:Crp/Fnr family transcriptional regulator n=1 Tax=Pedobacter sp. BAL39 TaxID=391596 RepID=UPI0001559847|nr:Crp/Fnr family transcriptional regulator [Pedobacter sp. BAL39]EDM36227.1 cyclic nucleotide binding-regulatory protein [Pedobacter sp. BAL39]